MHNTSTHVMGSHLNTGEMLKPLGNWIVLIQHSKKITKHPQHEIIRKDIRTRKVIQSRSMHEEILEHTRGNESTQRTCEDDLSSLEH